MRAHTHTLLFLQDSNKRCCSLSNWWFPPSLSLSLSLFSVSHTFSLSLSLSLFLRCAKKKKNVCGTACECVWLRDCHSTSTDGWALTCERVNVIAKTITPLTHTHPHTHTRTKHQSTYNSDYFCQIFFFLGVLFGAQLLWREDRLLCFL